MSTTHIAPLLLLAAGCKTVKISRDRIEPTFIQVSVQGEPGSAEEPRPFNPETETWTLDVQTLDHNADPVGFEGDLYLRVRPGRIMQQGWVTVSGSEWSGTIDIQAAFGPTRIWVSDEGDKNTDSGRVPSWATGVSDPVWYDLPTIAQMQNHEDGETNQLEGENAEIRVEDRQVVVTALGADGFWCTDLLDAPGGYGSLFVYTFNQPEGIEVGTRLSELSGGNSEYLGSTQLSFPVYEASGETLDVPAAINLTEFLGGASTCDPAVMEQIESAYVEITGGTIPAEFVEGSDDYADYVEYGQWPIHLDGLDCDIYIESTASVPHFIPPAYAGADVTVVRGMVYQVFSQWTIGVRDPDDLEVEGYTPTDSGERRRKQPSRPKPRLPRGQR